MPVTPTGPLSLPFVAVAELLAATTAWQAICGVSSPAQARQRIHLHDLDPRDPVTGQQPAENLLPCAVLLDEDGLEHNRARIASGRGELICEFLLPLDTDLTYSEQCIAFRNQVGSVLMEMLQRARTPDGNGGTYWGLTAWRKLVAPQVLTASESRFGVPDAMWCAFLLEWVE